MAVSDDVHQQDLSCEAERVCPCAISDPQKNKAKAHAANNQRDGIPTKFQLVQTMNNRFLVKSN